MVGLGNQHSLPPTCWDRHRWSWWLLPVDKKDWWLPRFWRKINVWKSQLMIWFEELLWMYHLTTTFIFFWDLANNIPTRLHHPQTQGDALRAAILIDTWGQGVDGYLSFGSQNPAAFDISNISQITSNDQRLCISYNMYIYHMYIYCIYIYIIFYYTIYSPGCWNWCRHIISSGLIQYH